MRALLRSFPVVLALFAARGEAGIDYMDPASGLRSEDVVTGLTEPTDFRFLPDGRIVLTEKLGAVKVRRTDGTVVQAYKFAVDIVSEKGLLGVEVDPAFATTGRLFFYYSNADSDGGTNANRHRVVSITLRSDDTLDPSTEKILVDRLMGPANHDGGGLAIGPDGKLYIGVGDTGCNCSCAPGNATNMFASCLTNGNGKVLRINLDGTIPNDNPLVGLAGVTACGATCSGLIDAGIQGPPRTDIWAWGFRNPFRLWHDKVTGKIWVGDVGEVTWEEFNILEKGRHYGWPWREGPEGRDAGTCENYTPGSGPCREPTWACTHVNDGACASITMGVIADACNYPPNIRGNFVYADNASSRVWTLKMNAARDTMVDAGAGLNSRVQIGHATGGPVSFQLGPDNQVYMLTFNYAQTDAGHLTRMVAITPPQCPDAGVVDAGMGDAGITDAGSAIDAGSDAGSVDAGSGEPSDGGSVLEPIDPNLPGSNQCACRTSPASLGAALAALLVAASVRRRRR
jgi:MYXO-CTERM domain-containing protein